MLLPSIKAALIASFWISALCEARSLDWSKENLLKHRDVSGLLRRQSDESCEITCSPFTCGGGSCPLPRRRDLQTLDFNETSDDEPFPLYKRVLPEVPLSNLGTYIKNKKENIRANHEIAPPWIGNLQDPTFCIQQSFRALTPGDYDADGIYRIGTAEVPLTGCTVLAIISRRGVYMCHLWEDAHFNTDEERYVGFDPVISLIEGRQNNRQEIAGPALQPNLFNAADDNTVIFIMTPRDKRFPNNQNVIHYPEEISVLKYRLTRLLPEARHMTQYNYDNNNDRNPYLWRNQAMFEYDPHGAGHFTPDWRLWFEGISTTGRAEGQDVL